MAQSAPRWRFDSEIAARHLELLHADQFTGMWSSGMDGLAASMPLRNGGDDTRCARACTYLGLPFASRDEIAKLLVARPEALRGAIAQWQDRDGQLARAPLTYETGIIVVLALAASLFMRASDTPVRAASRNHEADSIAEQFAAASDGSGAIQERLSFARRFRVVADPAQWSAEKVIGPSEAGPQAEDDTSGEDGKAADVGQPGDDGKSIESAQSSDAQPSDVQQTDTTPTDTSPSDVRSAEVRPAEDIPPADVASQNVALKSETLPFGALGAVVIRGLPESAKASAGRAVGSDWIVAPGDLANLEIDLPRRSGSSLLRTRIDVFDPAGVRLGRFALGVNEPEREITLRALRGQSGNEWIGAGPIRLGANEFTSSIGAPKVGEDVEVEPSAVSQIEERNEPVEFKRGKRHKHNVVRSSKARRTKPNSAPSPVARTQAPATHTSSTSALAETAKEKPGPLFVLKLTTEPATKTDVKPPYGVTGMSPKLFFPLFSKIEPGVFPKSPMEEEAARR